MYKVKVLSNDEPCKFEKDIQQYLDSGFQISVTNCGVISEPEGYSHSIFQAILVKEEF
jgi:hypothetical protein